MIRPADLPETIPLFPLSGALLLPRANLPLHIFEPRYLAMLDDALKTSQRLIGMVQPRTVPVAGQSIGQDPRSVHLIGCAGRVTQFTETPDRRYMITLTGVSRFRILTEEDGFMPYRRAQVSWGDFEQDLGPAEHDAGFHRESFMELLKRYFEARELQTDWTSLNEAEDELLINSLSMLLGFDAEEKQALLEAPSLEIRRETLVALMEFGLRGGSGEEMLQ